MTQPINAQIARLINRANDAAARGNIQEAQDIAGEAVAKAQGVFHKPSRTAAHYTLATLLWSDETAPAENAREHAAKAVELATNHTEEYYMAVTLLARIDAGLGNFEHARALNENLLEIYRHKGRQRGIADVLRSFGDIALKENNLPTARQYFTESLTLYENSIDDPLNQAGLLLSLGSLAFREGDLEQAQQHWEGAVTLGEAHDIYQVVVYARRALETLAEAAADD
jgi:tetratricopeptide (TPR) repeat protein